MRAVQLAGAVLGLSCLGWASAGEVYLGAPSFTPSADCPVGWRGDGSGRFPGATPPRVFDVNKNQGVVWRTEMPGPSFSSPILVKDKVFTMADPRWLICCDASSGKVLWQQDVDPLALKPEAEAAKMRQELAAIEAEFAAAEKAGGDKKALDTIVKKAAKLTAQGAVSMVLTYGEFFGLTNPTPASDGQRVYVHVTAGALAAYDLTGKRLWLVPTPDSGWSMGASSPVVVDGKVVLMYGQRYKLELAAFDAANGKPLWKVPVPNCGHAGSGTPVVLSTPKGKRLALPVQVIVNPADGSLSAHEAWNMLGGSPAPLGDRAAYLVNEYHDKERFFAVVQATGGAGAEGAKMLFKIPRTSSGCNVASPLIAGDLCYNFDKGHVEVFDLKTGSVAFTSTPADGKRAPPLFGSIGKDAPSSRTPSAAWTGSQIVLPFGDGRVLFLDPGAPPKSAATATLEPLAGSLFFQGDRIYARSVKALICVGPGK